MLEYFGFSLKPIAELLTELPDADKLYKYGRGSSRRESVDNGGASHSPDDTKSDASKMPPPLKRPLVGQRILRRFKVDEDEEAIDEGDDADFERGACSCRIDAADSYACRIEALHELSLHAYVSASEDLVRRGRAL